MLLLQPTELISSANLDSSPKTRKLDALYDVKKPVLKAIRQRLERNRLPGLQGSRPGLDQFWFWGYLKSWVITESKDGR
jgi:hypothetical protein